MTARYGRKNGVHSPSLMEQAFIYKVPEDFTLRTEEGEDPKDVAPVQKLAGHSRHISQNLSFKHFLICI